jgi:hypothetical protein
VRSMPPIAADWHDGQIKLTVMAEHSRLKDGVAFLSLCRPSTSFSLREFKTWMPETSPRTRGRIRRGLTFCTVADGLC